MTVVHFLQPQLYPYVLHRSVRPQLNEPFCGTFPPPPVRFFIACIPTCEGNHWILTLSLSSC